MAQLQGSRKATRDKLLDAVAALRLALQSIQSIETNILVPIETTASKYDYIENDRVVEAVDSIGLITTYLHEAIESCMEGAKAIAENG